MLGQESEKLCHTHPDHAEQINAKQQEIMQNWNELIEKAKQRKQKLDESYYLHRFLADFRELTSWITDMKAVICADELVSLIPYQMYIASYLIWYKKICAHITLKCFLGKRCE